MFSDKARAVIGFWSLTTPFTQREIPLTDFPLPLPQLLPTIVT